LYGIGILAHRMWTFGTRLLEKLFGFGAPLPKIKTLGIGNVHVGGTGKTPLALWLLHALEARHPEEKWGYLSRGYGRDSRGWHRVSADSLPQDSGDEALLVAQQSPNTAVGVCADRREGLRQLAQLGCTGVVLDDVLQHRRFRPQALVVACPWDQPWDEEALLPLGTLRDFVGSVRRAQAVVVTGTPEGTTGADWSERAARLRRAASLPASCPIYFTQWTYGALQHWNSTAEVPQPNRVVCVSGIAQPERFANAVAQHHTVVNELRFADHASLPLEVLLESAAHNNTPDLVLTAKDAARMRQTWSRGAPAQQLRAAGIQLWILPVEMAFLAGPDGGEAEALAYLCAHVGLS
jgi:tetraacyldisaccharide 4'-kinase